jgi:hypothetical protein
LSEAVSEIGATVIAYAVAALDEDGQTKVRLTTSWDDLNALVLDETAEIENMPLEPFRRELRELVRTEFDPMRAVARIEKENLRAGLADSIWNLLIAQSLL